ncbi:MAG: HD domain-containing protein [Promethearchaeota archaeon]
MNYFYINDAIYGLIKIPNSFKKIIDSKEFQRLRRIKQLAGVSFVYPSANHTRFEHSLGVMYQVRTNLDFLMHERNIQIDEDLYNSVIVAGLLHDLGHGPYSHNFEDFIIKNFGITHEKMTEWLIRKSEIGNILNDQGFNSNLIAKLSTGSLNKTSYNFLDHLVSGPIDCDSRDYLVRDSYYCGVPFGIAPRRIMILSDIMPNSNLGFDIKGLPSIESFIIARFNAFRNIYFHKTSRAVQIMIRDALSKLNKNYDYFKFKTPEDYLKFDDIYLYNLIRQHEETKDISDRIDRRELVKLCYEKPASIEKSEENPKKTNPDKLKEEIAQKAKLSPDEIYIDFPRISSVPSQNSKSLRRDEIPLFRRENGLKKPVKMENVSIFLEQIKGFYKIIRVYSDPKNRNKVAVAAKKVLVGLTLDDFF